MLQTEVSRDGGLMPRLEALETVASYPKRVSPVDMIPVIKKVLRIRISGVTKPRGNAMVLNESETIQCLLASIAPPPRGRKPRAAAVPAKAATAIPAKMFSRQKRCQCGECLVCRDNARWEKIFNEKFADPTLLSASTDQFGLVAEFMDLIAADAIQGGRGRASSDNGLYTIHVRPTHHARRVRSVRARARPRARTSRTDIEAHVAECDACAELGEQVDNIIEALGKEPRADRPLPDSV